MSQTDLFIKFILLAIKVGKVKEPSLFGLEQASETVQDGDGVHGYTKRGISEWNKRGTGATNQRSGTRQRWLQHVHVLHAYVKNDIDAHVQ